MEIKSFLVRDHPELLSYVEGFSSTQVILEDYFYIPSKSIFDSDELYNDFEVSRIMHLTDREYAQLVEKFLSNDDSVVNQVQLIDEQNKRNRLAALERKIEQSKKVQENQKRLQEIETEIGKLNKDLKLIDSLVDREKELYRELQEYSYLSKFDLQKIYNDLVSINSQIQALEEKSLQFKAAEIKQSKIKYQHDQGKIGLAIGVLIGMGIFGGIFYLLSSPDWLYLGMWLVGFFLALLLIFMSRYKVDNELESEDTFDYELIQNQIEKLKKSKENILSLVNMQTAEEFFLVKAKLFSKQKELEYLLNQKENLLKEIDYNFLVSRRNELELQKSQMLKDHINSDEILSSDEYLEIYKEIDSLKLALSLQSQSVTNIDKNAIPDRLSSIRSELKQELQSYSDILKSNFQKYLSNLNTKIADITNNIGMQNFSVDQSISNWSTLSQIQRFILYLALARQMYYSKLYLVCEMFGNWTPQDRAYLDRLLIIMSNEKNINLIKLEKV